MALLNEIIQRLNELFEGDLTDQDQLGFFDVVKGKLLESEILRKQAANNSRQQFESSPDLTHEFMNAIIGAHEAHTAMTTQALGSEPLRARILSLLLDYGRLYDSLREQPTGQPPGA